MVYVDADELRRHAVDLGVPRVEPALVALADPELAARLDGFVRLALGTDTAALSVQAEWCELLSCILPRYAGTVVPEAAPERADSPAMRRALSYLHDCWNMPVTLDRLAQEAGMAPNYFCRQFTRTFGLAPHRYQTVLRVTRAKALLGNGVPIADVAAAAGFSDQSHLGRQLKGCLGITPGELRRHASKATTF